MINAEEEVLSIFREEGLELVQRALAALNRAVNAQEPEREHYLNEVARLLHTLKGAAAAVEQEALKDRAHAMEEALIAIPKGSPASAYESVFQDLEQTEALLVQLARPHAAATPTVPGAARPPEATAQPAADPEERFSPVVEWLRVPPARVDQLHANLAELVLGRLQQGQLLHSMVQLREETARALRAQRDVSRLLTELRSYVPAEKYQALRRAHDRVSNQWNDCHRGWQGVCRDARVIETQSALVSQAVEDAIEGLRLMPLAPFFEGFAKAARDAARRENKRMRFRVAADGAEVDRSVLTRLHDALLHLVRNAVVHGLESPAEREAAGKAAEGELLLEASTSGTHVLINIRDDGRGLDPAEIRHKARARGLPDSTDLLDILTHPGFSTRERADDLAGRGVGLDVVASIVRSLDGHLELAYTEGRGCQFTLRVPISASTSAGLLMRAGAHTFGIMLSSVERVMRVPLDQIKQVESKPALPIDGEMVAVVDLAELLGVENTEAPADGLLPLVVIQQSRRRVALVVNEIPGEQELLVRPFGHAFRNAELFIGGAVQPDHSVIPVLSTACLFARAARTHTVQSLATRKREAEHTPRNHRALVVDDSITMRTLLKNVLGAAGYQVTVAEDGQAALDLLRERSDFHIVVTDLQMPRMDGISLCQGIRALPGSYLPVVMVTSVDDPEEKSRALAAGADAYVVKASFEQASFLKRVDTLVRGPMSTHA